MNCVIKNNFIFLVKKTIKKNKMRKLKNTDFSLVSSNCNGALILHDLGMRFNSPFVNLWLRPKDYIKLCSNLRSYLELPLIFVKEEGINYPIGMLKDIKIYFQHYSSKEEALNKWNTRIKRMNYDNLFMLFSDRDGCTYDDLAAFDRLVNKNKIVFTNKPYPEFKSSFYIRGFEESDSVGNCFEIMPHHFVKKYYDQFDYVKWFNQGKVK